MHALRLQILYIVKYIITTIKNAVQITLKVQMAIYKVSSLVIYILICVHFNNIQLGWQEIKKQNK